jgi:hypothetical protein
VSGNGNEVGVVRITDTFDTGGSLFIGKSGSTSNLDMNIWTNTGVLNIGDGGNSAILKLFNAGGGVESVIDTTDGNTFFSASGGNVGIGTTVPRATLDVHGTTTTSGGYALQASDSSGTGILTVRNDGNVGIGTATPYSKLDVEGGDLTVGQSASGWTNYKINFNRGDATGYARLLYMTGAGEVAAEGLRGDNPVANSWNVDFYGAYAINALSTNQYVGLGPQGSGGSISTPLSPVSLFGGTAIGATYAGTNAAPTNGLIVQGNVGIGTTSPSTYKLYVNGTGYLAAAAWVYTSDKRLKENISYFNSDSGLDKILQLKPAKFDYIDGEKNQLGFIAQDVQVVIPEAVVTNQTTGMLGLKTEFIMPYLVKAVQQQQTEINIATSSLSILSANISTMASSTSVANLALAVNGIGTNVVSLADRVQALELLASTTASLADRFATTTITKIASEAASSTVLAIASSTSFREMITTLVQNVLTSTSNWVVDRFTAHIAYIDRVEAETVAVSKGFEMADQANGSVYCITILNGEFNKRLGQCTTTATTTPVIATSSIPVTPVPSVIPVNSVVTPIAPVVTTTPVITTATSTGVTATSTTSVATSTTPAVDTSVASTTATTTTNTTTSTTSPIIVEPIATSTPEITAPITDPTPTTVTTSTTPVVEIAAPVVETVITPTPDTTTVTTIPTAVTPSEPVVTSAPEVAPVTP